MELSLLGWNRDFAEALASVGTNLEPGRVAAVHRGACSVWTASGECRAGLPDVPPVTGDWVALDPPAGRIRGILPRRTCLSRRTAGRACEEQVMAANVDVMMVVAGLDADFNPRRLERYLVLAEESRARPLVVLNKADLCGDVLARLRELDRITPAPVAVMSALAPESVSQLHRHVETGETAVLVGSSGAGKSSIVNALLGAPRQAVSGVREHDGRGVHTTTSRELFPLPAGWVLIDTPGMRELEVWTEEASVGSVFADIGDLAGQCRFRDCSHSGEPGCAVLSAVAAGRLDGERLESFHKLRRETDAQVIKRRGRIRQKALRRMQRDLRT